MDRFFRGFIAGFVGGIAMNLWTLVALNVLNWEIIRFVDWAGVIVFGDLPRNHIQGVIALALQFLWVGTLGIIFAFLIPQVTSQAYLLKGLLFGVTVGFIIYAIPTLFQMPILAEHSTATVVSNHIGGAIWGVVMSKTLHLLDKKFATT
jgi:uncharacterized membrane protein